MTITPLEEIEHAVHKQFDSNTPTKDEAGEFIQKRYPRMDGGISIAIGLAALILQGYQIYRERQEARRLEAGRISSGGGKCPKCTAADITKTADGKSLCKHGFSW
jgi:hypothetical protein